MSGRFPSWRTRLPIIALVSVILCIVNCLLLFWTNQWLMKEGGLCTWGFSTVVSWRYVHLLPLRWILGLLQFFWSCACIGTTYLLRWGDFVAASAPRRLRRGGDNWSEYDTEVLIHGVEFTTMIYMEIYNAYLVCMTIYDVYFDGEYKITTFSLV